MVSLSAGISIADECIQEFTALRMKRAHRYLILKVNDDKTAINIEHTGARDATFAEFKEKMPKDQCRYGIFELEYPTHDGRIEAKILFIMYAPDVCSSKEKFVIATTKDEVKKKLQPFNKEIQVNDWADLDDESFIKYFKH